MSGVNAMLRESERLLYTATEAPSATESRENRYLQSSINRNKDDNTSSGKNSFKHTCVGLLAAQQPIQGRYNSTAYDKSAKIAAFAWWHAGALRLKLGERAGGPAYLKSHGLGFRV